MAVDMQAPRRTSGAGTWVVTGVVLAVLVLVALGAGAVAYQAGQDLDDLHADEAIAADDTVPALVQRLQAERDYATAYVLGIGGRAGPRRRVVRRRDGGDRRGAGGGAGRRARRDAGQPRRRGGDPRRPAGRDASTEREPDTGRGRVRRVAGRRLHRADRRGAGRPGRGDPRVAERPRGAPGHPPRHPEPAPAAPGRAGWSGRSCCTASSRRRRRKRSRAWPRASPRSRAARPSSTAWRPAPTGRWPTTRWPATASTSW